MNDLISLRHLPFITAHKGILKSQIARSHDAILPSFISFIAEHVSYPEVVAGPILLNNDVPGDAGMSHVPTNPPALLTGRLLCTLQDVRADCCTGCFFTLTSMSQ